MSEYENFVVKLNDALEYSKQSTDELIVYTTVSNSGSKNAIEWLEDHEFDYVQRKVNQNPLTKEELLELLPYTDNGLEDLLSYTGRKAQLEDVSLSKAIDILIGHPRYIKKPILFNHKILQSGYHHEKINAFIPHEQRVKYYIGL